MNLIWKDIVGYECTHKVSNLGNVWSVRYKRNLKGHINRDGYHEVILSKNKVSKWYAVHRLVAAAFIGDADGREVNHEDLNKLNNRWDNLVYVTHQENMAHALRNGVKMAISAGTSHARVKLSFSLAQKIRAAYAVGNITQPVLGKMFGVSEHTVWRIVNNQAWTLCA